MLCSQHVLDLNIDEILPYPQRLPQPFLDLLQPGFEL